MTSIFHHLLTAPPKPATLVDLDAWWKAHGRTTRWAAPIDRALAGGFAADRPAYAFASGYQETLQQLQDSPGPGPTAFCATEEGGAHPRAVKTTLTPDGTGFLLCGRKTFVTLGTFAETLLVVARAGEQDGRPVLVVARLDARRDGVALEPLPELPFVPELPHAAVTLENVSVAPEEVLPGDGYLGYLKPMRTVEDVHVMAALLAWHLQVARRWDWPAAVAEDLLVLLSALRDVAAADPLAPTTHLALEGVLRQAHALVAGVERHWDRVDATTAERWSRDRALLEVAATARARRAEAAWKRVHS